MAERTEPIRQDIEATRASMTETLEQIEGQVREKVDTTVASAREALDLRRHMNERPWLALGAASLLGYVVGAMGGDDDDVPPRPVPGQPMRYYSQPSQPASPSSHSSAEERHANNGGSYTSQHSSSGRPSQIAGAMAQVADPIREELSVMAVAAVRSAMRMLRESLQESIPQFNSEYQSVQRERTAGDDSPHSEANSLGSRPGNMTPGNMTPGNMTPGNMTPGNMTPGSRTPSEAGSFGSRPGSNSSL